MGLFCIHLYEHSTPGVFWASSSFFTFFFNDKIKKGKTNQEGKNLKKGKQKKAPPHINTTKSIIFQIVTLLNLFPAIPRNVIIACL